MKHPDSGKLRIGDNWNAIRIIALSQSNPLKAVAEFVENSIDARAKHITLVRGKEHGVHFRIAPKLPVNEGIDAVRLVFSKCWFDKDKCKEGIEALKSYHKEYDETRKCYNDRPYHDWSSNGADAFRYMAVSVDHRESSTSEIETILRSKRKAQGGWMNGNYVPVKPSIK